MDSFSISEKKDGMHAISHISHFNVIHHIKITYLELYSQTVEVVKDPAR